MASQRTVSLAVGEYNWSRVMHQAAQEIQECTYDHVVVDSDGLVVGGGARQKGGVEVGEGYASASHVDVVPAKNATY